MAPGSAGRECELEECDPGEAGRRERRRGAAGSIGAGKKVHLDF